MTFKALILDCDGVIVDSEKYSCGAWNVVFDKYYNIDIGTNYDGIIGLNTRDAVHYYGKKYNLTFSEETILELGTFKAQTYFDLAGGKLEIIPGIEEIIKQAHDLEWPIIVASSGTIEKITFNLEQVNLIDHFVGMVSSQEVKRGKPFPDLFLEAAKRISHLPSECIVIEDSTPGIEGAMKSGTFTVAITTSFPREELLMADKVIDDYSELKLASL
ncbi:MAG: HAD family phosphatase [Candidatus Heimdallarchaeota archaeon]|nr:HAD family phosphatase [Candidatus Heimdallarchaeota archaeon]MCK5050084.1 HAD family phosphatase [Candidatus Heimdallarchaeota archaeon]